VKIKNNLIIIATVRFLGLPARGRAGASAAFTWQTARPALEIRYLRAASSVQHFRFQNLSSSRMTAFDHHTCFTSLKGEHHPREKMKSNHLIPPAGAISSFTALDVRLPAGRDSLPEELLLLLSNHQSQLQSLQA